MYCLSNPVTARSTGDFDSQEANQNTALGASLFGYFLGQCQKVTRSPKASGSLASCRGKKSEDTGFRLATE
jgi:hypothetical protein